MALLRWHFFMKMCMKIIESGPVGGHAPEKFVCRSANDKCGGSVADAEYFCAVEPV